MDAHADIAAIGLVPDVRIYLDAEADKLTNAWFTTHRVAIKGLSDERQDTYRQIKEMSPDPQDIDLAKPSAWIENTAIRDPDGTEHQLPRFEHHMLSDTDGTFPARLNDWETDVLAIEAARPGFKAWYRNPARSTQDSLAIAYQDGDRYRTVRPDFIFFGEAGNGEVTAVIVDPHSHHLADALPKLRGLAAYAAEHADHYQRIESVTKIDGMLRVLDLTASDVRAAIATADSAKALYEGNTATDY